MRRLLTRKRVLLAVLTLIAAAAAMVLLAPGRGAADTLSNISPVSPVPAGGWMGRYPITRYQLDEYFSAVSVSLLGGVDVSGLMPMVAYAVAQVIWLLCAFISNVLITVFGFAFNLNLLTGEGGSGGALAPIAQAIHSIYASTFGAPWLIAAIVCVGVWAMWKALVQRRYAATTAALLTSFAYCVLALVIIARPAQTITPISRLSNQMSSAFLSLTDKGSVSEGSAAEQASSGQLFQTLVLNPWTVLEFGGIDHCLTTAGRSGPVQPLSKNAGENANLTERLEDGTEVGAEGKRCIDNRNKYAPHFLAYPYQTPGRNAEYEALKTGEDSKLPSSDPSKSNGSYPLSAADKPAAEASGKGGQYERLLLSILIFAGELGIWVLLAGLAAGVILAQILLLLLLAFAPVALVAGVFPGRGHSFFVGWIGRMLGYLARKAVYSLILAVLLAVCQALQDATSGLGWLMSFLLQAAFCWAVLLQRRQLTTGLMRTFAGDAADPGQTGVGRLQSLYYASSLAKLLGGRQPREQPAPNPGVAPQRPSASTSTRLPRIGSTTPTTIAGRPAPPASTTTRVPQPGSTTSTPVASRSTDAPDQEAKP